MVELIDLSWKDEYVTFDSQDTKYKSIFGAVPCNQSVTFNIEINKNAMINCVYVHFFVDNLDVSKPAVHCAYEMKPVDNLEDENNKTYSYTYKTGTLPRLVFYYF